MKKKVLFTILIVLLIAFISTTVFADEITSAMQGVNGSGNEQILLSGRKILGIVQAIGLSVAVIMIVVIAIRFMMESAEGKAEIKKNLMPYIIGAVLLFATSLLPSIAYMIGEQINKVWRHKLPRAKKQSFLLFFVEKNR